MQLLKIDIDRIIIHQIYQKGQDGNEIPPTQSHEYTNFDEAAMTEFKIRVNSALAEGSKAVQMEIVNQEQDNLPSLVNQMIDQDRTSFADFSFEIAKKLSVAQKKRRSIPGGIVVVFSGTHNRPRKRFIGIIKAEVHSAYEKQLDEDTKEISLKFVEEVLLTPGSRLYKTAGFFEKETIETDDEMNLNSKWDVLISDYQINQTDGKAAAEYFYADFSWLWVPTDQCQNNKAIL